MSERISEGLYRLDTDYAAICGLPLWLYLVVGADGNVALLDAGASSTPAYLEGQFPVGGVELSDVKLLVNSHAHADHSGGSAAILATAKARLAVPCGELDWVEDRERYVSEVIHGPCGILGRDDSRDARALDLCGPTVRADIALRHGDVHEVGDHLLRVVVTSGHSPGHIAVVDQTTRTLFSFDVVQGRGLARDSGHPRQAPLYVDVRRYVQGLERLLAEDFDVLAPSHGPVLDTDNGRQLIEESIEFVHELDAYVASVLRVRRTVSTLDVAALIGEEFGNYGGVNLQTAMLADAHLRSLAFSGNAVPLWSASGIPA